MSKTIPLAIFFGATVSALAGEVIAGRVTNRVNACDYFVVQSKNGYSVLEWFGGYDPSKDDVLIGDFESYGMKTLLSKDGDNETTVYVEDYQLSKSTALEKLIEKCE